MLNYLTQLIIVSYLCLSKQVSTDLIFFSELIIVRCSCEVVITSIISTGWIEHVLSIRKRCVPLLASERKKNILIIYICNNFNT